MTTKLTSRPAAVALLAMAFFGFTGIEVSAEEEAPTESQQLAGKLLSGMADYLAGLPGFKVRLIASYDSVQDSGQKIEFNEIREVTLSRPNLLRIEQQQSDGASDLTVFDGKEISIFDSDHGVYAKAPQPGSVDDSVVYFVRDLGIRLPLAAMLSSRLPEELSKRVQSTEYVELTNILGTPAHHVAVRMNTVDLQVWIADGERPLPLRVVLTYKYDVGQPQFRAQFLDWDVISKAASNAFEFKPPAGASQIIFAVQAPASAAPAGELP